MFTRKETDKNRNKLPNFTEVIVEEKVCSDSISVNDYLCGLGKKQTKTEISCLTLLKLLLRKKPVLIP